MSPDLLSVCCLILTRNLAEKWDEMWKSIEIAALSKLTRDLPVDLYLQLGAGTYCHVFSKSTGLDYRRLVSYRQKGVSELFYKAEDHDLISRYVNEHRMDELVRKGQLTPEQKAGVLLNWTEQTAAQVFSQMPVTEEAARESRELVTSLVDLMSAQPQSLAALLRLVSHGDYLYYHSVAVSIFSGLLARVSQKYSDADIRLIAWGGFLHDVGLSRMEEQWTCDPLIDPGAAEVRMIEEHCQLGVEAIQELEVVPKEVRFMVFQHHESPDGKGLPNRLKGSSLHPPAMLIALVDAWAALISRHPHRDALTPAEALAVLESDRFQGRFDEQAMEWLKQALFPSRHLQQKKSA
jgi:putative nucleotidyltransferase with HDIG domain